MVAYKQMRLIKGSFFADHELDTYWLESWTYSVDAKWLRQINYGFRTRLGRNPYV